MVLYEQASPHYRMINKVISLTVAYQKIKRHITLEMEMKADTVLNKWFPDHASYEVIE